MPATLPTESLNQLFVDAHTHTHFTDKPVSDDTLHQLYELLKWGPSSANSSPARFVFVKSPQAKEKLLPCVIPQNAEKVKSAPVTAILAMDSKFYDQLPRLYPVGDFRSYFVNN
jgi:3-hydroxypropanoate dehydrogenase